MTVDGEPIESGRSYRVVSFRRPGAPERDLGGCGFLFREITVTEMTPVDLLAKHIEETAPVTPDQSVHVRPSETGGPIQNTPADGPYPYVQPGVDFADGEAYVETAMIPTRYRHPVGPE